MVATKQRRRTTVDDPSLAVAIGARLKQARLAAGLTQAALAGDRYTKAYISALEHGLARPSMAALDYLAPRLGTTAATLLADRDPVWDRVQADLAMASGDWTAALDRYTSLHDAAPDRATQAGIGVAMAECLCRLNRARQAVRPAAAAAEAYRALGRTVDLALAEYWLASAQYQAENLDEARLIVTDLLRRVREGLPVEDDFHVRLLVSAAMIERSAGHPAQALAYLEEARGRSTDLDGRRRAAFLATLASASREAGDLEAAIRYGQDAVTLMRAVAADEVVQDLENELALAYLANGNLSRAAGLAGEARRSALLRGDLHLAAHLIETEAQVALAADEPATAVTLAGEAIDLAEKSGNDAARLGARVTRARASAAMGDHEAAATDYAIAAEEAADLPARRREVLSAWADTLAALGQHERAFAVARAALEAR